MSIQFKLKDLGSHVLHFAHVPEAKGKLPMFLFHGGDPRFNGWHVWKENLEAMSQHLHPHALDLVGYGKSHQKKEVNTRIGASDQAKVVLELIDSYDISHFGLGGLSWGASVANAIIQSVGSRVKLLLLVSPAVSPDALASPLLNGEIATIIVACPQDPVVPIARSKLIHDKIPNSQFMTIDAPEGTEPLARAHHIQSLCPDQFNQKLLTSLETFIDVLT